MREEEAADSVQTNASVEASHRLALRDQQLDGLYYIVGVIAFYVFSFLIFMIKYVRRQRRENSRGAYPYSPLLGPVDSRSPCPEEEEFEEGEAEVEEREEDVQFEVGDSAEQSGSLKAEQSQHFIKFGNTKPFVRRETSV